jgi:hypothetical protein
MQSVGLNEQIRHHAEQAVDWQHNKAAQKAYAMYSQLNGESFGGKLPQAVIGFDDTGRLRQLEGHYHFEGDGISLFHHIDLRKDLSPVQTAIALLHNAVHLESETYETKTAWYHSMKWRARMCEFGFNCDEKGRTESVHSAAITTLATMGLDLTVEELDKALDGQDDDDGAGSEEPEPLVETETPEAEHHGVVPILNGVVAMEDWYGQSTGFVVGGKVAEFGKSVMDDPGMSAKAFFSWVKAGYDVSKMDSYEVDAQEGGSGALVYKDADDLVNYTFQVLYDADGPTEGVDPVYGVDLPTLATAKPSAKPKKKMFKYTCGGDHAADKIYAAPDDLRATCDTCGFPFVQQP